MNTRIKGWVLLNTGLSDLSTVKSARNQGSNSKLVQALTIFAAAGTTTASTSAMLVIACNAGANRAGPTR